MVRPEIQRHFIESNIDARPIERGAFSVCKAMGVSDPGQIQPGVIFRRVSDMKVRPFDALYDDVQPGAFLNGDDALQDEPRTEWGMASADRFA